MSFRIYDCRKDKDSVLITPEIRAKFMRMEPGQIAELHGHELGVSVFLMLEGKVTFTINGEAKELGPGEMCVALADEKHIMLCTSSEPALVYLSVTPHIQPTHTMYDKNGGKVLQRHTNQAATNERLLDLLCNRHLQLSEELAERCVSSAKVQADTVKALRAAVAGQDLRAAAKARTEIWQPLFSMYRTLFRQVEAWNALVDQLPEELNWPEAMTPIEE